MELIGIYLVASAVLVVAGFAKALRPGDTARALSLLLPLRAASPALVRALVRAGAAAEVVFGLSALAFPGRPTATAIAASYLIFVAVVLVVRRRGGPLATCGCFGRPDTPPTLAHLGLDLLFAGAALSVAVAGPLHPSLLGQLASQPWAGLPLVFVCGVGVGLSVLTLSSLGALEGARRLLKVART